MRFWFVRPGVRRRVQEILVQADLAIAAIAAGSALLTQMIGACVFRALHTDARGMLFADITHKWHGKGHWAGGFVLEFCAGWRDSVARQR